MIQDARMTSHHRPARRSPAGAGRRPVVGLVFVAWLAVLVGACSSPEEQEAEHLARGIELLEAGDNGRALVEFRNVLRLNPKNAQAMYHAAQVHERAGRLAQAYAAYEQAVGERPGFVAAHARLGAIALADGNLERAAAAAEAIEKVEPTNPSALAIRGSLALRRGDSQAALELAGRALEAAPRHEEAVAVLAGAYHRLGEGRRALERLDEAIAARPETVSFRVLKILILEDLEARTEADLAAIVSTYEELFTLEPDIALHRIALADFHRREGDLTRAEDVLRTAILDTELETRHAARGLIRLILQEQGFEAAVAELESLIERRPDDPPLRFLLAELHASEQQFEAAQTVLDTLISREQEAADTDQPTPVTNDARATLARVRLAAGDLEAAEALASQVLAADRTHREGNLVLGVIALERGAFDEAIRSARAALRQEPNWLPGLRLVAEAHLAAGDLGLARTALDQIVAMAPNDVVSLQRLAQILTDQGDFGAALKLWDRAVQLSDDPGAAIRARAEVEMRRGNYGAARADIEHLLGMPEQALTGTLLAGDLMLLQNRFEESRSWFERAAELQPEAPQPMLGLVRAYVAAGDPEGGLGYLEQRLQERPDEAVTYDLMAGLLIRLERPEEAEDALREAIRLQPDWLVPYRRLGQMLRETGEPERAIEVYQAALAQQPDHRAVLNELAYTHYVAGNHVAAADAYERLLQLAPDFEIAANNFAGVVALYLYDDPDRLRRALDVAAARFRTSNDPNRLDVLGWLHYRDGDYPLAATFLERAVAADPKQPEFRYHLGMALYRSGRKERALEELGRALTDDADYPGLDEAKAVHAELQAELEAPSSDPPANSG